MEWKRVLTGPSVAAMAALAAGLFVLLAGTQGLGWTLWKRAVEPGRPLYLLEDTLGLYEKAGEVRLSKALADEMGTERYVFRSYREAGGVGPAVRLLVAYRTGVADAVPHIPRRLFSLNGARGEVVDRRSIELPVDRLGQAAGRKLAALDEPSEAGPDPVRGGGAGSPDRLEVPVTLMRAEAAGPNAAKRVAGYFFVVNGGLTGRVAEVRRRVSSLRADRAYWCRIEVLPVGMRGQQLGGTDRVAEAWPAIERFLRQALPGIIRTMPDWKASQRGQ